MWLLESFEFLCVLHSNSIECNCSMHIEVFAHKAFLPFSLAQMVASRAYGRRNTQSRLWFVHCWGGAQQHWRKLNICGLGCR